MGLFLDWWSEDPRGQSGSTSEAPSGELSGELNILIIRIFWQFILQYFSSTVTLADKWSVRPLVRDKTLSVTHCGSFIQLSHNFAITRKNLTLFSHRILYPCVFLTPTSDYEHSLEQKSRLDKSFVNYKKHVNKWFESIKTPILFWLNDKIIILLTIEILYVITHRIFEYSITKYSSNFSQSAQS